MEWAIYAVVAIVASYFASDYMSRKAQEEMRKKSGGTNVTKVASDAALPIFYGQCLNQGGTIVFMQVSDPVDEDPTVNDLLHMVIVWGEAVESIDAIYLNDVNINSSKFDGDDGGRWAYAWHYPNGLSDVWPELKALGFGEGHDLSGCAVSYVRLEWDAEGKAHQGRPNVTADITGRKIWNPSTGTKTPSSNPALQLLDYLRDPICGKGLDLSLLDLDSFKRAAIHCDLLVETYEGSNQYEPLFESHVRIDTDDTIKDNVSTLVESMRGMLPVIDGRLHLLIDDDTPAVDFELIDTHNIAGGISHQKTDSNSRYNQITVKFWDKDARGNANEVVFPVQDSDLDKSWLAEDNHIRHAKTFTIDTCNSAYLAKRYAETIARAARSALTVELNATAEASCLVIGDVVPLTHQVSGWDRKLFKVLTSQFTESGEVKLTLREHDASLYQWHIDAPHHNHPGTTLPEPWICRAPENVRSEPGLDGAIIFKWYSSYRAFDVQIEQDGWPIITETPVQPEITIDRLDVGEYVLKVRARNRNHYSSSWVALDFTIALPGVPTVQVDSFSFNAITLSAAVHAAGLGTQFEFQFLGSRDTPVDVPSVPGFIYTREGLLPETTYLFRVRTVNSVGKSAWVDIEHQTDSVSQITDIITGQLDLSDITTALNENTHLIGQNKSSIETLEIQSENQAQQINQVSLKMDETASQFGAVTQAFDVLQTDMGTMQSQYTIKTDANGVIAGIGLISDSGTGLSQVAIMADQFAIMPPGYNPQEPAIYPFSFNSQEGKVFINAAMILDADILNLVADKITGDHIQAGSSLKSPIIHAGEIHSTHLYSANLTSPFIDISSENYSIRFDANSRYPVWFGAGRVGGAGAQFYIDSATQKAVFRGELGADIIDWRNMRDDGLFEVKKAALSYGYREVGYGSVQSLSLTGHQSKGRRITLECVIDVDLFGTFWDTSDDYRAPELTLRIEVNDGSGWSLIRSVVFRADEGGHGAVFKIGHQEFFDDAAEGKKYDFRAVMQIQALHTQGGLSFTHHYRAHFQSSESFIKFPDRLMAAAPVGGIGISSTWNQIRNKPDVLTLSETPGSQMKCFGKEERELHTPPLGLLPFDSDSRLGDNIRPFKQVFSKGVYIGPVALYKAPNHPALLVDTPYGKTTLGAVNGAASHFITDRPVFHFNQPIQTLRTIGSSEDDFVLSRKGEEKFFIREKRIESLNPINAPWLEEGGIAIDSKYLSLRDFEAGDATVNRVAIGVVADFIKNSTHASDGIDYTLKSSAIRSGFIKSNMIAAGTITAQNLAVTARSLVNNFSISGVTHGWDGRCKVESARMDDSSVTAVRLLDDKIYSDRFEIDHNTIYEVTLSILPATASVSSYSTVSVEAFSDNASNVVNRWDSKVDVEIFSDRNSTPSRASGGTLMIGRFHRLEREPKHFRAYIIGCNVDISNMPEPLNSYTNVRLLPETKSLSLELYARGNPRWFSPSVKALSGGHIVANSIDAQKVFSDEATIRFLGAKVGRFIDIDAERIQLIHEGKNKMRFSSRGDIKIYPTSIDTTFAVIGSVDPTDKYITGLSGNSYRYSGVHGHSVHGAGVSGSSKYGVGVSGSSSNGHGVYGAANVKGKAGIYGVTNNFGSWGGKFDRGWEGHIHFEMKSGHDSWPGHQAKKGTFVVLNYRGQATAFINVDGGTRWERVLTSSE